MGTLGVRMKFFTAAWATGELPDEEYEAATPAYAKHLSSLCLPTDLKQLAESDLHDAVIEAIDRQGGSLKLSLVTGDLQRGYYSTNITYRGFAFAGSEQLDSADEATDILYDEIDRHQGRYVHRFLLSTYAQVEITFDSVVISMSPRGARERTRGDQTPN